MTASVRGAARHERREVVVRGIVQGVGFRPHVYLLAQRFGLAGWVRNEAEGVRIAVEGRPEALDLFLTALTDEAPPLARVDGVHWTPRPPQHDTAFTIELSRRGVERNALIAPDVATCEACRQELFDPSDRRYRYPFINCTNCGPRFTITLSVPYDRAATTMARFPICPACRAEYDDPRNRRFHAQPNACPVCGPRSRLLARAGDEVTVDDPVAEAARLLQSGAIVAIKGLGGYHLACDPLNEDAVRTLRERKVRQDKPFALMASDLQQVRLLCVVGEEEEALIAAPARPIVLLDHRASAPIAGEVAPRQRRLGVMLAYTPLHYLLLHDVGGPLVMTSGNRSDEPIAYRDDEAREQLGDIADYFLTHNRPIHIRCDDSVVDVVNGAPSPLRRSRGYAPAPLRSAHRFTNRILACGAHLKSTFCLAKDQYLFLSHYIGDLESYQTVCSYRESIAHYERLFDVRPDLVAHDLHPDYLSTAYAVDRAAQDGLPAVGVQHHHAHLAACLVDNAVPWDEPVIGVAFDGTGYGTDRTIWGGEFFTGSIASGFRRAAHLSTMPVPGGEAAIRHPWQMAIGALLTLYGDDTRSLPLALLQRVGERNVHLIERMVASGLNAPLTSSAGRVFDTVAALLAVPGSQYTTYEGQAAIELESVADGCTDSGYAFAVHEATDRDIIDTAPIIRGVVDDLLDHRPAPEIASRFHRTMAELVAAQCARVRAANSLSAVALSGGTFQNRLLLSQTLNLLQDMGFTVYRHRHVPANDGGIGVGQAALAQAVMGTAQEAE